VFRPSLIIVHHSATRDSGTVSWDAIRRYHVETNKWKDIGYHAGVELVGDQYVIQHGRPWTGPAAHTAGQNSRSLGFCFVGDYDVASPDMTMLALAARAVLAPWCRQFGIKPDDIRPHSEFAPKTCPGKLFPVEQLREMVRAELGG
jgi:N-acetylmuramoyl-L-alanine amidase